MGGEPKSPRSTPTSSGPAATTGPKFGGSKFYKKQTRIQKAWGNTAHRGWARLLLDRARDLIIHGSAHRGANGVAMPTDEDDQDGHFLYNHPERGAYFAA